MRILTFSILLTGLMLVSCATRPDAGVKAIELFDGKTLNGWSCALVDNTLTKDDVWSVRDGILVCKGEPLGYLHTDGAYQDFHLVVEWRWAPGTKPGNSGVLLRIASDPVKSMPRCVEAQLENGNAGDIWAFLGAKVYGDASLRREVKGNPDLGDFMGYGKIKAAETTPGQWNRYDITLNGSNMELRVNGVLVNQATGLDVLAGPIGLQSEGGEIHFRKVELTQL